MTVLEVIGLEKEYTNRSGGSTVRALRGVNFAVDAGEYVAIMGESGSGKTTLLNILASLDEPTGGRVLLDGKDLADVSERELAAFRRDNLGFVFQDFNLLDTFSVRDNILLPLVLGGVSLDEMERRLEAVTVPLGIDGLLSKFPYELSGGQRQALTLLMATLVRPKLLLLDEHTAALDPKTAAKVLELTEKLVTEQQLTTLMITHNMRDALRYGNRLIMMHDGRPILDVRGEEKAKLTAVDLLQFFEKAGDGVSDKMLLG